MIKSNLAIVMAEKKIKISELSRKTGISRVTLTSLYYNNSGGIQFDTLNNLCNFLSVKPSDILVYYPFDYKIKDLYPHIDGINNFKIEYIINNKTFSCSLEIELFVEKKIEPEDDAGGIIITDVFISVYLSEQFDFADSEIELSESARHFQKFFNTLPSDIKNDMESYIITSCFDEISNSYYIDEESNINFEWEI